MKVYVLTFNGVFLDVSGDLDTALRYEAFDQWYHDSGWLADKGGAWLRRVSGKGDRGRQELRVMPHEVNSA